MGRLQGLPAYVVLSLKGPWCPQREETWAPAPPPPKTAIGLCYIFFFLFCRIIFYVPL